MGGAVLRPVVVKVNLDFKPKIVVAGAPLGRPCDLGVYGIRFKGDESFEENFYLEDVFEQHSIQAEMGCPEGVGVQCSCQLLSPHKTLCTLSYDPRQREEGGSVQRGRRGPRTKVTLGASLKDSSGKVLDDLSCSWNLIIR